MAATIFREPLFGAACFSRLIGGANFGGWSSDCTNTEVGTIHCTVNLSTSDATVGAIFNDPTP